MPLAGRHARRRATWCSRRLERGRARCPPPRAWRAAASTDSRARRAARIPTSRCPRWLVRSARRCVGMPAISVGSYLQRATGMARCCTTTRPCRGCHRREAGRPIPASCRRHACATWGRPRQTLVAQAREAIWRHPSAAVCSRTCTCSDSSGAEQLRTRASFCCSRAGTSPTRPSFGSRPAAHCSPASSRNSSSLCAGGNRRMLSEQAGSVRSSHAWRRVHVASDCGNLSACFSMR
mmetsp:Transcript_45613/g.146379  ORF Transcript_45613/g.146379 Transcript_45613/m.146379 type:complete len:236 (+) Transcript_45613:1055-1762(+)